MDLAKHTNFITSIPAAARSVDLATQGMSNPVVVSGLSQGVWAAPRRGGVAALSDGEVMALVDVTGVVDVTTGERIRTSGAVADDRFVFPLTASPDAAWLGYTWDDESSSRPYGISIFGIDTGEELVLASAREYQTQRMEWQPSR